MNINLDRDRVFPNLSQYNYGTFYIPKCTCCHKPVNGEVYWIKGKARCEDCADLEDED